MTSIATLGMLNLDCAHASELAHFYAKALGWEVTYDEGPYAMASDGLVQIGFGEVEGYTAPNWPDDGAPKRYHLDLSVADLDDAQAELEKLGATLADPQPQPDRWRVLLDPAGHPFCISPRQVQS